MTHRIYRMPERKSSINIEDLDANIERIIDKKLDKIYKILDTLETKQKFLTAVSSDSETEQVDNKSIH